MIPLPQDLAPRPGSVGVYTFRVNAMHTAYDGHFPDHPILPGVLQIDWAIRLGVRTFGNLGTFKGMEHLKFQSGITPGEAIEIQLTWDAAKGELGFAYTGPSGPKSSGIACFSPAR
jgi:3-hydroxymyristoyl/3-hydroxydecanoyl-(acyl carrier protein) dehydratase